MGAYFIKYLVKFLKRCGCRVENTVFRTVGNNNSIIHPAFTSVTELFFPTHLKLLIIREGEEGAIQSSAARL